MTLDANSIVVRLLIACLVYFLFGVIIDTFVKDAQANQVFKIVLIFVCIAIVFVSGFFVRL